jgi:hypothetical protein
MGNVQIKFCEGRWLKIWFGGMQVVYILIRRYVAGCDFDMGVHKYQKVKNTWSIIYVSKLLSWWNKDFFYKILQF